MSAPVPVADLLQQLEELRAAATPGPWQTSVESDGIWLQAGDEWPAEVYGENRPADAALIVAAVNSLPRLTAAVRAALALADELASWPSARILSPHDAADRLRSALTAALTEDAR